MAKTSKMIRNYELVSIEETEVPEGAEEEHWYRYVIRSGNSTITGQRAGTLEEVTAYATDYAEQLNARSAPGYSAWGQRTKKQA